MAERLPRRLGEYLLLHPLGKGGMGKVYLARKQGAASIARYCVVKTLRTEGDADKARRFLDEARLVVHLNHRNICTVSDVGADGGTLYLVMDLVAGRDVEALRQRMRELTLRFSFPAAMVLIRELLEALDYAHRLQHPVTGEPLGLVHRDVSPQNVMISFEGEVKLIDFGLAASSQKSTQTRAGFVLGKLQYLAPEQVRQQPVDARADQFAAAVLSYEVLSGSRYYEDLSNDQIWQAIVDDDYRPAMWATLESDVAAVLSRALLRDKNGRYPTCAAFRQALEQVVMERQLTGGADELRVLMRRLHPEGPEQQRTLLQRYASVEAEALLSAPAPVGELLQTTEGGAVADDRASTLVEPDTEMDAPPPPPSSLPAGTLAPLAEPALLEPLPERTLIVVEPDLRRAVDQLRTAEEATRTERIRLPKMASQTAPIPRASGSTALLWVALVVPVILGIALLGWMVARPGDARLDDGGALVVAVVRDAGAVTPPPDGADGAADGAAADDGEDALNNAGANDADEDAGTAPSESEDAGSPDARSADAGDWSIETDETGSVDEGTDEPRTRRRARRAARRRTVKPPPADRTRTPRPTTTAQKLQLLKVCKAPCARRLVKRQSQGAELDMVELRRYLNAIDACVQKCL